MPQHDTLHYASAVYHVAYTPENPWFVTLTQAGTTRQLALAAGVHTPEGLDGVGTPVLAGVGETPGEVTWRFSLPSRSWTSMETVVRLRETDLDFQVVVQGTGQVARVSLLEGAAAEKMAHPRSTITQLRRNPRPLRAYAVASPSAHATIFCPQPESYHRPTRPYHEDAMVTAACTFGPDTFNTYFSPGIFCFVLGDAGEGRYLSAGLCAQPGEQHFHTFRYHGGEVFGFTLEYDGMVAVEGQFASPRLRIGFAADTKQALAEYVAFLRAQGLVQADARKHIPAWWRRPVFCGWGQQTHWGRAGANRAALPFDSGPIDTSAGGLANQQAYGHMVQMLDANDIPYGTLTIDMGWSVSNAMPVEDPAKWPDLRGFIDAEHARGKKVLLWMCCWTTHGVPADMLMAHDEGLRDVIDPTKPAFAEELAARITRLIAPDGLNADGFKLDFTGDIPRGVGYRPHRPLWGVELLHHYLALINGAMKAAKPDAMLETHCASPYFADVTDVLRLNDMFFETLDVNPLMAFRADMARLACPEWPIDTDNDPFLDRASWMDYMRFQPRIGIPSLYTLTHMSMSGEPALPEDLPEIARIWRDYLAGLPE